MARVGGNPGNKGGGRHRVADAQIQRFKGVAWDKIVERVTQKNKQEAERWLDIYIPMFASKLMPQQVEGSGEGGALIIKFDPIFNATPRETKKDS